MRGDQRGGPRASAAESTHARARYGKHRICPDRTAVRERARPCESETRHGRQCSAEDPGYCISSLPYQDGLARCSLALPLSPSYRSLRPRGRRERVDAGGGPGDDDRAPPRVARGHQHLAPTGRGSESHAHDCISCTIDRIYSF